MKMSKMTKVLKEWFRHLGIAITMVLATIGIMWLFCFLIETISLIGAIVIDILLFVIVLNILKWGDIMDLIVAIDMDDVIINFLNVLVDE